MEKANKWISEYIENINLEKIEWIKLNSSELNNFIRENYLDEDTWQYVRDENVNSLYPTLLGMHYLNLDNSINNRAYSFLLGIVDNNIGKKTIVGAAIYLDEYFIFTDQESPLTYISTMEVNSYFRNRGIYKKMCEVLIKFVNQNQHIITTMQSEIGLKCHVFEILKEELEKSGFKNYIFEDSYHLINSKLHNIICFKQKVLKK